MRVLYVRVSDVYITHLEELFFVLVVLLCVALETPVLLQSLYIPQIHTYNAVSPISRANVLGAIPVRVCMRA